MFPLLESAKPVAQFAIGDYEAVLVRSVQSLGRVQYHYVMAVTRSGKPALWVTSEYTGEESRKFPFLCVFQDGAHSNYGNSPEWRHQSKFTSKAISLAMESLGIQESAELRITAMAQKPWWRLWQSKRIRFENPLARFE